MRSENDFIRLLKPPQNFQIAPTSLLHHHFGDKRGLFRAVFEELEREIVERVEADAQAAWNTLSPVKANDREQP